MAAKRLTLAKLEDLTAPSPLLGLASDDAFPPGDVIGIAPDDAFPPGVDLGP